MSYRNLIFLAPFIFSTVLAMDPPMKPPVKRRYPLNFQPMCFADDKDDDHIINPHPISITALAPTFEGIDVNDLETVFEAAPKDAKWIIKQLTKFVSEDLGSRASFLIDGYGTGKTVLAKALAYKLCSNSHWSYEYISSREFVGEYRNQTGVCLRSYLKKIVELKRPTLLIIDQFNKILEYTKSSSDDTSFASDLICNFLDNQERNENIFLLGIMDRATKLDQRLKSRILLHCIRMPEPTNPQLKRITFTSKLINDSIQLHPEVTNEWLTQFLENAPAITGRNFRCLALHLKEMLEAQGALEEKEFFEKEITLITQSDLQSALESYLAAQKHLFHVDPYESHIDRAERFHQEQMAQREQIHQEQMAQRELAHQEEMARREQTYRALLNQIHDDVEEQQENQKEEDQEQNCSIC